MEISISTYNRYFQAIVMPKIESIYFESNTFTYLEDSESLKFLSGHHSGNSDEEEAKVNPDSQLEQSMSFLQDQAQPFSLVAKWVTNIPGESRCSSPHNPSQLSYFQALFDMC